MVTDTAAAETLVPATVPLLGRMRWVRADFTEDRSRYSAESLAEVAGEAIDLAVAAGAAAEHRILRDLSAARAALAAGNGDAEDKILALARDLLAAAQRLNADMPDEIYRAQRARAGA